MHTDFMKLITLLLAGLLAAPAQAGPEIESWTQANGAKVFFVRADGLPMVDIQMVFDAGSARDGEQFGVAAMTSLLLDKGAGDWDVEEIAGRLEGVGAKLDTDVSRDSAVLTLRSLSKKELLETALDTAAGIVSQPRFSESDFAREQQRVLTALRGQMESPAAVASKKFFYNMYGRHPYAHPTSGEAETVSALKRDDVVKFFRRYYVSRNTTVVIVGKLSRDEAESVTARLTRGMKSGDAVAPIPAVDYTAEGKRESVEFPSAQTHIFSGMPAVERGDPDYFALYIGNHILGGSGLVSRISEQIREKRGLAYSARSSFSPLKQDGPFSMGLQTRNDQSGQALEVLNQTLREFIQNGPDEEELEAARKNITGGFVLRYDSNAKLAGYVAMIGYYGLPLDYLDTFAGKVNAVTPDQIKEAFRTHLKPDRFQTVLVGGASQTGETRSKK